MAGPIEAKHDAPWLRRRIEEMMGQEVMRVVDLDRGVERTATPEEMRAALTYRDYDHFMEEESSMTNQTKPDATLSTPVDAKKDQVNRRAASCAR